MKNNFLNLDMLKVKIGVHSPNVASFLVSTTTSSFHTDGTKRNDDDDQVVISRLSFSRGTYTTAAAESVALSHSSKA